MNKMRTYIKWALVAVVAGIFLSGCAPKPMPAPTALVAPIAIMDNSGEYLCPYTQDGVMAEWTDKAITVSMSASVGSAVGALAGQKLLEQVPFIGGFLGEKVGNAAGRAIAVNAIGGEEFIKESSDISFNNINDMSVYMYVKFSTHEHYADALKATIDIYPEVKQTYIQAIYAAGDKR